MNKYTEICLDKNNYHLYPVEFITVLMKTYKYRKRRYRLTFL